MSDCLQPKEFPSGYLLQSFIYLTLYFHWLILLPEPFAIMVIFNKGGIKLVLITINLYDYLYPVSDIRVEFVFK